MASDDQAASEKGEQAGTDIEQGEGAISQGRSYECTFCKRGFSNAQALGGHMNIHRKDKAKLKQSPNETKPTTAPEDTTNLNWPWNASSGDQTHLVDIRQLPLFAETPYSCSYEPQKPRDQLIPGESTEKGFSSSHASSLDLDLELRLGPEPQDSSPATSVGTRKFF